jgi:hypothetical protein
MADVMPPTVEKLEGAVRAAANWCYWIAGLTVVNAIAAATGSEFGFPMGSLFGMTAMQAAAGASAVAKGAAIIFNLGVVGFFVVMAIFARKEHRWAFVVAFVGYLLDSLILAIAPDVLSIALHALALFFLGGGIFTVKALRTARAAAAAAPPPLVPVPSAMRTIEQLPPPL